MSLFMESTQAAHWTLTPAALQNARLKAATRAADTLASNPPRRRRPPAASDALSPHECATIRLFHERRLLKFCAHLQLVPKVCATAVTFFKRFFVHHAVTEFNPAVIALSSLYAAAKVEEVCLPVDSLVDEADKILHKLPKDPKQRRQGDDGDDTSSDDDDEEVDGEDSGDDKHGGSDDDEEGGERLREGLCEDKTCSVVSVDALLKTELDFLQRLRFHLICYHPFRSLGIVRELLREKRMWWQDPPTSAHPSASTSAAAAPAADPSSASLAPSSTHENNAAANTDALPRTTESETLSAVATLAERLVLRAVVLSDLPVTHAPASIALALTAHAATALAAEVDAESAQRAVLAAADAEEAGVAADVAEVCRTLERLEKDRGRALRVRARDARRLEKRRRAAQCDENDPMSRAFREREEGREQEAEARERERGREMGRRKRKREKMVNNGGLNDSDEDEADAGVAVDDDSDELVESARKKRRSE